jgi:hypothetical protein
LVSESCISCWIICISSNNWPAYHEGLFFWVCFSPLACSSVSSYLGSVFQIMVCSNHMNTQDDVNQVVIHELIHAYDDCRAANLDWADCAHHACSEVCITATTTNSFS